MPALARGGGERVGVEAGWAGVLAVLLLVPVAMWLLFRVVALAVLQFFADEVGWPRSRARHYSGRLAAQARPLPFRRDLANSLRGLMRALGYNLLALPVAGLVMFTAVRADAGCSSRSMRCCSGRELTDMGLAAAPDRRARRGRNSINPAPRAERLLLGAGIAGLDARCR